MQQRKNAIKPWRAKYDGTCCKCEGRFKEGSLVCRISVPGAHPLAPNIGHYPCHPDFFSSPLKVGPL